MTAPEVHKGQVGRILLLMILLPACPGYLDANAFGPDSGVAAARAKDDGAGGAGSVAGTAANGGEGGGNQSAPSAAAGGAGGAGGAEAEPVDPFTLPGCAEGDFIAKEIFEPKCGKCHGGAEPKAGLDLKSPGARIRLVNVPAKTCTGDLEGEPLIPADNGQVGGILFKKLAGMVEGCGQRMPFMQAALSDKELACLEAWIIPPALPDAGPAAPPGDGQVDPSCLSDAQVAKKILTPKCNMCHSAVMQAGKLDLESKGVRERLIDVDSKCLAIDKKLVTKEGDVAVGHLFDKLEGAVAGCGNRMPLILPPLEPDEKKCLKDWLSQ